MNSKKNGVLKLTIFTLLLVGLIVAWLGFGERGFIHLYRMEGERQAYLNKIHKLEAENKELLDEIERLKTDKEYIEAIARRELNLIKEGEIHYRFQGEEAESDAPAESGKNTKGTKGQGVTVESDKQ